MSERKHTGFDSAPPNDVQIDEMNERRNDIEVDDLVDNIERIGVVQPPMVRENDDGTYTAVIGQRRVLAAREAGLDEIPVIVMDWDDHEALKASITENIGLFRQEVPMHDRAQALQTLWEQMGGNGRPVPSHLGAELGVPRNTIRTWLEPLNEKWEGTSIDPNSSGGSDDDFFSGESLGERSLADIRRMTGGGEEGEAVARAAAENDLGQTDIQAAKELVEESDADPYDAIEEMADDGDDNRQPDTASSEPHIEAEVTFDSTTSIGVRNYADRTGQSADEVIAEAVHWFLDAEGALPSEEDGSPDETPGFDTGEPVSSPAQNGESGDSGERTKTVEELL